MAINLINPAKPEITVNLKFNLVGGDIVPTNQNMLAYVLHRPTLEEMECSNLTSLLKLRTRKCKLLSFLEKMDAVPRDSVSISNQIKSINICWDGAVSNINFDMHTDSTPIGRKYMTDLTDLVRGKNVMSVNDYTDDYADDYDGDELLYVMRWFSPTAVIVDRSREEFNAQFTTDFTSMFKGITVTNISRNLCSDEEHPSQTTFRFGFRLEDNQVVDVSHEWLFCVLSHIKTLHPNQNNAIRFNMSISDTGVILPVCKALKSVKIIEGQTILTIDTTEEGLTYNIGGVPVSSETLELLLMKFDFKKIEEITSIKVKLSTFTDEKQYLRDNKLDTSLASYMELSEGDFLGGPKLDSQFVNMLDVISNIPLNRDNPIMLDNVRFNKPLISGLLKHFQNIRPFEPNPFAYSLELKSGVIIAKEVGAFVARSYLFPELNIREINKLIKIIEESSERSKTLHIRSSHDGTLNFTLQHEEFNPDLLGLVFALMGENNGHCFAC